MVEDVEDLSDESSVISALEVDCDSSIEEAEVVDEPDDSGVCVDYNNHVEQEVTDFTEPEVTDFTNDGEMIEVWTRDYSLTLEQNFTPPSERNKTTPNPAALFQAIESGINPYLDTDDDWTMASTNSFDSYNHRLSWSPDNATNNPELEVRLW